jgi:transcriptional regulator with XRE-family HTH domain
LDLRLLQKQVAELCRVDTTTVTNWELGHTQPAIRQLPAILGFLGSVPFGAGAGLPDQLRHARRLLGLSQEALARQLGVDESTVWKWELGRSRPIRRYRQLLERFLDRSSRQRRLIPGAD